MERKKRTLFVGIAILCLALFGLCAGAMVIIKNLLMPPERKALPRTASDIHERHWIEEGLVGQDSVYILKARITKDEFLKYVDELSLTPHTPSREYALGFGIDWYHHRIYSDKDPAWWKPHPYLGFGDVWVHDGDSWWLYAKYEEGYVYIVFYNI